VATAEALMNESQAGTPGASRDPESPDAAPPSSATLLVVDDEPGIVESLQKVFEREGLRVFTAAAGAQALEVLRKEAISVLLTDLLMPGMSGMDLLKASRSVSPETETILMTAYGTVENAVEAMKQGAYDFVTKPIKRAHVVRAVLKALEKRTLVQENRSLRAQLDAHQRRKRLIGQSLTWRRTMETTLQAAPSMATVLLLGESGTGKELLARAIHEASPRADGPFVPVNCAALPETILEAELFGYERGAFTGAVHRHDGRFLQADKGTLFLDEIGEIPTHVQVKLLRVLQEGEVERLGGRTQRVDIRLVAATNQDLRAAVKEGRFREDLYYRLNVIALRLPPLRERRDDVPLLAEHFLRLYGDRNRRQFGGFTRAALDALCRYEWPGNVRELENTIERAVVLARGEVIDVEDLPVEVRSGGSGASDSKSITFAIGTQLAEIERRVIHATLSHVGGDKRLCAQLLGIATRTIYRRLEEERDDADEPSTPGESAMGA
jgi:two-component system, NtrC family, response regulator HydG